MCSSASTRNINKILSVVFFIVFFGANAYGTDGYIFPDYHRLLMNGKSDESALLLYDSSILQGNEKLNHFTLAFDHHNTAGQYPIKITFSNSTLQTQSYDFPPGELQYLQKKIDMILENRKNDLSKAR